MRVGGIELELHSLLTSALYEGEWLISFPCRFIPWKNSATHCTEGYEGFRVGLDVLEEIKSLVPTGIRTPDNPARSIVLVT
jgi:hypothetical protein